MKKKTQNKKEKKEVVFIEYIVPQQKIQQLAKIGDYYKVPFVLPPFDDDCYEEGCYDIDKFRLKKEFSLFLREVEALKLHYEYAFKKDDKKKIYMTVKVAKKEKENK